MGKPWRLRLILALLLIVGGVIAGSANAQEEWRFIFPEQRHAAIRDPACFPRARLPNVGTPETVSDLREHLPERRLTLDEAIRSALESSKAIRLLAGETATPSGQTIYDATIVNTQIDQRAAQFDPQVQVQNTWGQTDLPEPFTLSNPLDVRFAGERTDTYNLNAGVTKNMVTGGQLGFNVTTADAFTTPYFSSTTPGLVALNPQQTTTAGFNLTQPLLQGAGPAVNLAPIVIARINTERSFFQMKDSTQQMVRGVIQAYWALVFARADVLAKDIQVQQSDEGLKLAQARFDVGMANFADVAQAKSALETFRAALVTSRANLLQSEGRYGT